jgi:hypothetical protein
MARIHLLAGTFLLLGAIAANAQGAPSAPPSQPAAPESGMQRPPMGGRGEMMRMHMRRMAMMQKSAGFRFKRDGAEIDIRCAADEPMKACVDAASLLIDKVVSSTAAH